MKRSWIVVFAITIIVAVAIVWRVLQPEAVVSVVSPRVETLRAFVEEQAETELPHDVLIAMPIAGWLEPIRLREGDRVEQGQVVARLDTDDLMDRVHQAEQRVAVLDTQLARSKDHRLEENALVETHATVKAIHETVAAAEKKLEAARAILEFAESEQARVTELFERSAAAERELREVQTEYRRAHAEYQSDALELAALETLEAVSYIGPKFINDYVDRKKFETSEIERQFEEARLALEIEKRNLQRAEITSPIAGVILHRHQTRRQYLAAGTPLLTLGDLGELEVIAEVLTQRATRIHVDDPVEIFGEAISDGPVAGRVLRVYPAGFTEVSSLGVEQQRVNVAIALERRPVALGVGFRVQVRIFYDEAADALTLPRTALFRSPEGQWQVMTVENGVTQERSVEVGLTNDERAQIVAGLTAGAAVVAHPSREIEPGMRVEMRGRDPLR